MRASTATLWLFVMATFASGALRATDWSTLFTAQDVHDYLATSEGRVRALNFCRRMGLSKVYVETFRDGYQADAETLCTARDYFRQAGLQVSGCVTTTQLGKPSTGWNIVACYTHRANQERLAGVFAYAAGFFDEIMIDDFFFTDCECSECAAARGAMGWREYRKKLMLDMSRENVLGAAQRVNPNVKVILKFPQWYDTFQERGYVVDKESALYDRVWVGTELRDPASDRWGHKQQYEGFFIFRWISDIAKEKTAGGWFDPYGTNPTYYLDQAYVTVLAGAREGLLFHYGALESPEYDAQARAFAARRSELEALSKLVGDWRGIPAYKPASSDPGKEAYLFDQIGMLGIPLLPTARFPQEARVALFTAHALEDVAFVSELVQFLSKGGTAFLSEELAHRLNGDPRLDAVGPVELAKGEYFRKAVMGGGTVVVFSDALPRLTFVDAQNRLAQVTPELGDALGQLRQEASNFAVTLSDASPRVAAFPMGGHVAVMNFTELPVSCRLQGLGGKATRRRQVFRTNGAVLASDGATLRLPPHALLVVK